MYKIYGLIDPRTDKICYIGQTKNTLKSRLRQHNSPKITNKAPIAKLLRCLKRNNMKLDMFLLSEHLTKEECDESEINTVKKYRDDGYKLKNIQDGGYITNRNEESLIKFRTTRKKNRELGLHKMNRGDDNVTSVVTEKQVLEIYNLIKKFYNNEEIIKELNLTCLYSTIPAIRCGQNWKWLWLQHFKKTIPSIFSYPNGISPRIKLKVIDLIVKGYSLEHIGRHFPRVRTDLKRVYNKEIWVKVWEVYYEFYVG